VPAIARPLLPNVAVVDRLRGMMQLAAGLDATGRLNAESRTRAIECLQRFGQRLRHVPPQDVRAVGTNALRATENAEDFLVDAELALGHPIATISGVEEALLLFLRVAQTLPELRTRRLVVDTGGAARSLSSEGGGG